MMMSVWLRSLFVSGAFVLVGALSAMATEPTVSRLQDRPKAATTVKEWMAQTEAQQAQLVRVTGVKVNPTPQGLEIALETENGQALQATQQAEGDTLILTVPNAVLALSSGQAFEVQKPGEGIDRIAVTQADATTIRVSITGLNDLPSAEIVAGQGLVLAVTPEEGIEEEITVTGEGRRGYRVPNASTATRTDTPIRDIPGSIQVVPQEVLRDRRIRSIGEGIETVSGVVEAGKYFNGTNDSISIRGFTVSRTLRNGFPENAGNSPVSTIPAIVLDRLEILKGPSSVVSGAIEPGGIINYVTKQPLRDPSYKIGFEAGSFGRYQPSIDLSGPLTADKNALYRLIAAYERRESIQKFGNSEITSFAPSISFKLGDRTDLDLYFEYSRYYANPFISGVPVFDDGSLPERSVYPGYPGFNEIDASDRRAGYSLTHSFNENLQIRNNFAFTNTFYKRRQVYVDSVVDNRFLRFGTFDADESYYNYYAGVDLLSKFRTGSVSHNVLIGLDFNYYTTKGVSAGNFDPTVIPFLDIRNPNYNALTAKPEVSASPTNVTDRKSYGLYIQDQITFSDQWKLLIGGRYDWISDDTGSISLDDVRTTSVQNDAAFSPRIGLVYQPSKTVSLYASYTQSFNPAIGRNPDDRPFEPTKGTQYEAGVKTDFFNGRLSATLAAYNITKTNVLTPDPDPSLAVQGFQVQVGEQRSRGIELDVAGEILPGWRIIASYAYTDATVTTDNSSPSKVGNRLANVPQNQASLWTTYEIQKGNAKGLGFGFGLFYVGDREGDLENTFSLGDYLRTDAAVYYRRNGFNAAINIRNLFNVNYISSSAYKLYVDRGEPFTVVGSIGWEF
ncbi:TonB-dependent siderophore receptor [Phormidesmis sp. 146-33]